MKTYSIDDFQIGEIVFLKTDFSTPMVISKIEGAENVIRCYWRDKANKKSYNEVFPPSVLCKSDDKPKIAVTAIKSRRSNYY